MSFNVFANLLILASLLHCHSIEIKWGTALFVFFCDVPKHRNIFFFSTTKTAKTKFLFALPIWEGVVFIIFLNTKRWIGRAKCGQNVTQGRCLFYVLYYSPLGEVERRFRKSPLCFSKVCLRWNQNKILNTLHCFILHVAHHGACFERQK